MDQSKVKIIQQKNKCFLNLLVIGPLKGKQLHLPISKMIYRWIKKTLNIQTIIYLRNPIQVILTKLRVQPSKNLPVCTLITAMLVIQYHKRMRVIAQLKKTSKTLQQWTLKQITIATSWVNELWTSRKKSHHLMKKSSCCKTVWNKLW